MLNVRDFELAFNDVLAFWPGFFEIAFANLKMVGNIGTRLGEDEIGVFIFAQVRVQEGSFF
jgi:hypothetical protein